MSRAAPRRHHRAPTTAQTEAIPTKPSSPNPLVGQAAALAAIPRAETPRGGEEFAFRGITSSGAVGAPTNSLTNLAGGLPDGAPPPEQSPFAGMGPLLEESDADVFQTVNGLVLRQELIALNHLHQDVHWTVVKLGYPWSTLTKEPNRDRYTQAFPYGNAPISIQGVPNKAWDMVNKTVEALLVDFPQVDAEPIDDTEEAEAACDMANQFLRIDASEQGTNDAALWHDRAERALTCASSYVECWTDPTGGGYVPLQIPAHPEAESPMHPLVGPDGMPTASPVMRYVTSVGPDGQATPDSQFTDDATQAAPQWQPKLRAARWQREHIRVYPETATVDDAEKVIILGYCTLSEAKRRWPAVAKMAPEDLSALCDWTPQRYLVLLPPFQRARWRLSDGRDKEKSGSSDERIMFYYHVYVKACPDHPKGADVVVTGALDSFVINRTLLAVDVELPTTNESGAPRKESRCMTIPVVQITPRGDPDELDPSGRAYIELFAGAVENSAHLAMACSEAIDKNLHLEAYSTSTSPISGDQREDARATGDIIPVIRPDDIPHWGEKIPLDETFFKFYELSDNAVNSIASQNRPAQGSDQQQEVSGKARQIAVSQNNVALGGMNVAVNTPYQRWCRIKLERAMADFTTEQQIGYVGEDGLFKQQDLRAMDFALVGKITIKTGTGTLLPSDQKVQYLGNLNAAGLLTSDEARDAARPSFSQRLGLTPDPHEQRVERQISAWHKGPPSPEWVQEWTQYQENVAQHAQVAQVAQQQGIPAPPAPPMPWTPFEPLPNDDEPQIAGLRHRKLSRAMSSAKFGAQPKEWQQALIQEYQRMRQVEAQAMAPPTPPGQAASAPSPQPTPGVAVP